MYYSAAIQVVYQNGAVAFLNSLDWGVMVDMVDDPISPPQMFFWDHTRLAVGRRRLDGSLFVFAQVPSSPRDPDTGTCKAAALSHAGNRRFHASANQPECFHTSIF